MGTWKKRKRIDLNPSGADRWTTCTASPKYIFDNWDRLPPDNRQFADPGNTAHEVAAALLQGRKVNPAECPAPRTAEMNQHAWDYMEYVENLREPGARVIVEQKLPLFYAEGRNAIVDAAVINNDNLHVIDYKYGEGVIVSPVENLQATIYAKSVMWASHKWNIQNGLGFPIALSPDFPVFVHIFQPRTREEETAHVWETTWGDINARALTIAATAKLILDNASGKPWEMEFAPSEKACQFCPAKGFCEARPKLLTQDLPMLDLADNSTAKLPNVPAITMKQLAAVVKYGDQLKKWIDDAQDYALHFMRTGHSIPGFKLVTSRGGNRYWTDPAKVARYLLEDTILREEEVYTEPKIVGPATIEKLLGKGKFPKRVYNLIGKPPGQPVIAPEDDPRPSALINGAEEFVDLDAEEGKVNLDQV